MCIVREGPSILKIVIIVLRSSERGSNFFFLFFFYCSISHRLIRETEKHFFLKGDFVREGNENA